MFSLFIISRIFQILAGIIPLFFLSKRKINLELKLLVVISLICSILLFITGRLHLRNVFIFNTYQFFNVFLLSIFYYNIIDYKPFKKIVFVIAFLMLTLFSIESVQINNLNYFLKLEKICFVFYALLYFINYLISEEKIYNFNFISQVNTAFLIYYSFSFLFNVYIDELMIADLWFIHNFIEALSTLVIAYAFWKLPKKDTILETKN